MGETKASRRTVVQIPSEASSASRATPKAFVNRILVCASTNQAVDSLCFKLHLERLKHSRADSTSKAANFVSEFTWLDHISHKHIMISYLTTVSTSKRFTQWHGLVVCLRISQKTQKIKMINHLKRSWIVSYMQLMLIVKDKKLLSMQMRKEVMWVSCLLNAIMSIVKLVCVLNPFLNFWNWSPPTYGPGTQ